jgi:hypothetical protein
MVEPRAVRGRCRRGLLLPVTPRPALRVTVRGAHGEPRRRRRHVGGTFLVTAGRLVGPQRLQFPDGVDVARLPGLELLVLGRILGLLILRQLLQLQLLVVRVVLVRELFLLVQFVLLRLLVVLVFRVKQQWLEFLGELGFHGIEPRGAVTCPRRRPAGHSWWHPRRAASLLMGR